MKEILYAKYNRIRESQFQTKVEIEVLNGKKRVRKTPLKSVAIPHVDGLIQTCSMYKDYYNQIDLIESYKDGESVCCDFISGKSAASIVSDKSSNIPELIKEVEEQWKIVSDVNSKYCTEFEVTDDFLRFFGEVDGIKEYKGLAYTVCNLDSILENFLVTDESKYTAIDYEWFVNITIPAEFILFRLIRGCYVSNAKMISVEYSMDEFCVACGINEEYIDTFKLMDDAFQHYVYGPNWEAIYTNRYNQPVEKDCLNLIEAKNQHIHNLEVIREARETEIELQKAQIAKYKKAFKNPFFGFAQLCKKIKKKLMTKPFMKGLSIWKHDGFASFRYKLKERKMRDSSYENWISALELKREKEIRNIELDVKPCISVLVPVYNVAPKMLKECLDSVVNQSYPNWELCIVDDCSTMKETLETLKQYENTEKIKIQYREENGHISKATNQALSMATGEYIALLDCDDVLTKNALLEVAIAINNNPNAGYIYSDEDKIDENGTKRFDPFFKPDWSPDSLMSFMYTCHLSVYKKEIIEQVGGFRVGLEGSQDYDLALRCTEIIEHKDIVHIPYVLYHWRTRQESTSSDVSAKPYVLNAAKKAKEDACERRGLKAKIEYLEDVHQFCVNYIPSKESLVSIIIPSKDNPEILKRCISSIKRKTRFKNYEIIVVDNGSNASNQDAYAHICNLFDCRYLYQKMDFNFSRMCNIGAQNSQGEYLLFLNDDIEVLDSQWLERMLGQAELDYAGAVGAKLLYPNTTFIQHCGVINLMPGPSHALGRLDDREIHYFGLNKNNINFIAVTAACLLVKKSKFEEIGGFDENLQVAYNDVDLCFKLVEAGYFNVVRNDVVLYHYESFSRGLDTEDEEKTKRLMSERDKLFNKHPQFALAEGMDPYYNHFLVQTNIDYSYNLYNLNINETLHVTKESINSYRESQRLKSNVESLIVTKKGIYLSGWAYLEGYSKNNTKPVKVLFISKQGDVFRLDSDKVYRPDLRDKLTQKQLGMVGFIINSTISEDYSDCKVAIAINNEYKIIKG